MIKNLAMVRYIFVVLIVTIFFIGCSGAEEKSHKDEDKEGSTSTEGKAVLVENEEAIEVIPDISEDMLKDYLIQNKQDVYEWFYIVKNDFNKQKNIFLVVTGNDEVILSEKSDNYVASNQTNIKYFLYEYTPNGFTSTMISPESIEESEEFKNLSDYNGSINKITYILNINEDVFLCVWTNEEDAHNNNETLQVYKLVLDRWNYESKIVHATNDWETGEEIHYYYKNDAEINQEIYEAFINQYRQETEFVIKEYMDNYHMNNGISYQLNGIGAVSYDESFIYDIGELFFICKTSSALEEQLNGETIYHSYDKLFDGNLATAWVEASYGDGIGEWISLATNKKFNVDNISIAPGYSKNETLFLKNNRVKKIKLIASTGEEKIIDIDIKDMELQTFDVGFTGITSLLFYVEDIEKGSSYNDLCISELKINNQSLNTYGTIDENNQSISEEITCIVKETPTKDYTVDINVEAYMKEDKLWNKTFNGIRLTELAPASNVLVYDGYVFVQIGSVLYCMNEKNGETVWKYEGIGGCKIIAGNQDNILVTSYYSDLLYSFGVNGILKWKAETTDTVFWAYNVEIKNNEIYLYYSSEMDINPNDYLIFNFDGEFIKANRSEVDYR